MPEDVRRRFQEGRADLLRHLEPAMDRPAFQLAGTDQAESRLDALEQARALHQVVGHAGALLQRARLPQADSKVRPIAAVSSRARIFFHVLFIVFLSRRRTYRGIYLNGERLSPLRWR